MICFWNKEIKRQHTDLTSEETKKTAEDFKALSSQIGFDANLLDEFFKKVNQVFILIIEINAINFSQFQIDKRQEPGFTV